MYWLSFCFYCGGAKTEQQTWIKRHNPCENNPNPRDYFQSLSKVDLTLGLYCASSCLFYFQWLRFPPEKTDFIVKHTYFSIQGRKVFGSVIRWSLTWTVGIRYNFSWKQRKPPNVWGSGIGQTSFGRFQS